MSPSTHKLLLPALASAVLVVLPMVGPAEAAAGRTTEAAATPSGPLPGSFSGLVKRAKPAVVTVIVEGEDVGRGMPDMPEPPQRGRPQGIGSGFIVDPSGLIVTNNHVVGDASEIRVGLDDGTELPATLLGRDEKTDLALLRVDAARALPTVPWGDSDGVAVGDWVVAIGNPFGLGGSVTAGIVSGSGRDLNAGPYDDFLQVDAAINRGNSGGPLMNTAGEVIGVNSAIFSPTGGNVGLGFAIPSNLARGIVEELQATGRVERGYLGVAIQPVTPEIAEGLGLDAPEGALVAQVLPGTPAARAGLRIGDVITGFGGAPIAEADELPIAVANVEPGESRTMRIVRAGETRRLDIEIGRMPDDERAATQPEPEAEDGATGSLGLALADPTPELRRRLELPAESEGAIVTRVDPDKPADAAGIAQGDLIVGVGDRKVASAREAADAIREAERAGQDTILLLVARDGRNAYVPVETRTG